MEKTIGDKSSLDNAKKAIPGAFPLAMLNVAAILSIFNLPSQAQYGWSILFYSAASTLCFFLPSALVSAELASAYPRDGGVYLWVKEAFGARWGFVAIFMQWVENLPWFPAVLTFVASAVAYVFKPELAQNRTFVFLVVIVCLWGCTLLNFRGLKLSAFLSGSGAVLGTIVPGLLIVVLAGAYLFSGQPSQIPFHVRELIPDLSSWNNWMLLSIMMVGLSGMEMSAVHIRDVKNPAVNFPRAILISCALVVLLSVLCALGIAMVIPEARISYAAGALQAFQMLLDKARLGMLMPAAALLLAYGALATVITWLMGPARGMLEAARQGYLPALCKKSNRFGTPVNLLIFQTTVSSVLALVIFFMPTISGAFWIMSALASQLYMIMYLLMFAAAIRLRYKKPDLPRPYRVPFGKPGIWIAAGAAFLTALTAILAGFIPTESVRADGDSAALLYIGFLGAGMIVFPGIPLLLYHIHEHKQKRGKSNHG